MYTTLAWADQQSDFESKEPQQSDFESKKSTAYQAFADGRMTESAALLKALIAEAPTKSDAANLQRDLVEVCLTGYLPCYYEANQALFALIQADKSLARLYPDLMLYAMRERLWVNDRHFIQQLIDKGGPSIYAAPQLFPATYAEMQLALHPYYVTTNNLKAAEEATSAAILGLLLSDPGQAYTTSKLLIGIFKSLLTEQDIVGAFQFLSIVDPYISTRLSHHSVLYADYIENRATLFGFTKLTTAIVKDFTEAKELFERLDIPKEIKAFHLSIANSSASAVLALDNKLDQALELHSQHPTQNSREEIIKNGSFRTLTEFYFALSDVFLSALAQKAPDSRWKSLFEAEPTWDVGDYVLSIINAYRSFALGCIEIGEHRETNSTALFIAAAKARIDIFEKFQRTNFEGFQLPNFIDKILIGVGLKAAANAKTPEAAELMLRGGEVLLRNLRHSISDDAILLASQPNDRARENARSYINLVREKRDWELKQIKRWLATSTPINKGAVLQEYSSVVTTLANLKDQFINGSTFLETNGLPSIAQVQSAVAKNEAFITYFPMVDGFGRLCINASQVAYSFGVFDQTAADHIRLLEFATTATFAPNPDLDSQYPVTSAIYLNKLLFDGLDGCMKPGAKVVMSLPPEFSGIPVSALLSTTPPRSRDGYELKNANWLVKQFSFSFVISARQFLAVRSNTSRTGPPLDYLGVGAPKLDNGNRLELKKAFEQNGISVASTEDLIELPDAAKELDAVARDFGAKRVDILTGSLATEEKFRLKPLGDYDVIHFATHGVFNENVGSAESGLILTPVSGTDPFNDGLLTASEISRLSLRARMVVLSACNSAKYNQQQTNLGIHDLQAAFTIAGTPTILAAAWSIESTTSADLMVHFIETWRSGQFGGASESLAQTVRSFLKRADAAHQHPRFWAAFQIFGNGAVAGSHTLNRQLDADSMRPFSGFDTGGEVVAAARFGTDIIFSLMGDWNGKRMAGIVISRDAQGKEKWRVTSKEIAAGAIAVSGQHIFSLGSEGINHFTPVIREIDKLGRILWTKHFSDLNDYWFSAVTPDNLGAMVVAYPRFLPGQSSQTAYLMRINWAGETVNKVPFLIDTSRLASSGANALLRIVGDRVIVAASSGALIRVNPERKNILGWPSICFEGASVNIFEFKLDNLTLRKTGSIGQFQVNAMEVLDGDVIFGGEWLDNCSQKGVAALLKLNPDGTAKTVWKDSDIFPSSIRGIVIKNGPNLAVNSERSIGINVVKPVDPSAVTYQKRYGDDNMAIREGSIIELGRDGMLIARRDLFAGLSVYLTGAFIFDDRAVVYGSIGGEPASTLH